MAKEYDYFKAQTETVLIRAEQGGRNHDNSSPSERRLAAAVFQQALADLKGDDQDNRRCALVFLLWDNSLFPFWCQQLNLDPKLFRRRLRKHLLGPLQELSGEIAAENHGLSRLG